MPNAENEPQVMASVCQLLPGQACLPLRLDVGFLGFRSIWTVIKHQVSGSWLAPVISAQGLGPTIPSSTMCGAWWCSVGVGAAGDSNVR